MFSDLRKFTAKLFNHNVEGSSPSKRAISYRSVGRSYEKKHNFLILT